MNTIPSTRLRTLRGAALLMLGALALSTTSMRAQDTTPTQPQQPETQQGRPGGRGGRMGGERQVEMLTKQLNLSPDQVDKLKAIDADTMHRMTALRDDTSTPQGAKRAQMMAIRQDSQTKVRAMLLPDQQTKFDAMMEKMRERREEHRDGAGTATHPPATAPAPQS